MNREAARLSWQTDCPRSFTVVVPIPRGSQSQPTHRCDKHLIQSAYTSATASESRIPAVQVTIDRREPLQESGPRRHSGRLTIVGSPSSHIHHRSENASRQNVLASHSLRNHDSPSSGPRQKQYGHLPARFLLV